jgi:hypothetical protein
MAGEPPTEQPAEQPPSPVEEDEPAATPYKYEPTYQPGPYPAGPYPYGYTPRVPEPAKRGLGRVGAWLLFLVLVLLVVAAAAFYVSQAGPR